MYSYTNLVSQRTHAGEKKMVQAISDRNHATMESTHEPQKHHPTPTKARLKGAIEFCEAQGLEYRKEDVFNTFEVPRRTGYRLLKETSTRRLQNNPELAETRGRKSVVTQDQIREMEKILETEGIEGRGLTWEQLGMEASVDTCGRTIKNVMGTMHYCKCIACNKGWVSSQMAERRKKYARKMLEKYPKPEDWDRVRFSDEVHFGWGPRGKLRIIRKPGQRYCADCIQYKDNPDTKDEKRFHCWAAIGYNFKSDIYFYDVPTNTNGKMSQRVYIDQILEPVVKPWLEAREDFVLEEDGDSGHGTSQSNIVRTWKKTNKLEYFFNCASSPDLAPIENCWQTPKQHLRKYPHWDDSATRELVLEG